MAQSDKVSICKSVIEWLCTHNNSNYNVHSQLYSHVLQFHGNQHTINNNNNTLHSLMMVHYQWIIHYTQILTVHTSVVPVTSYVSDHYHL